MRMTIVSTALAVYVLAAGGDGEDISIRQSGVVWANAVVIFTAPSPPHLPSSQYV